MRHSPRLVLPWLLVVTVALLPGAPARAADTAPALPVVRAGCAAVRRACEADAGRTWGVPLWGPVMFVDPTTRAVVASVRDSAGALRADGDLFVGTLPTSLNIANTSVRWSGVTWTQLMWPLPDDADDRDVLIVHELFHRVQDRLGIVGSNPANAHLDTAAGRTLLQLEWRALAAALAAHEPRARRRAIADALVFRAARRRAFAAAAGEERQLEQFEGLAEYTGVTVALATPGARTAYALRDIERQRSVPSFVRSFAYASGPAYGVLLDGTDLPWRERARRGEDLGALLAEAAGLTAPVSGDSTDACAARYDGERLRAAEQARWDARQAALARWRARLVDGPTLRIALQHMNVQFDPRTLVPLGEAGTVYPTLRIADDWGVLTVTGGALLAPDWSAVSVCAPTNGAPHGDGWELQLGAGWKLVPLPAPGHWTLAR